MLVKSVERKSQFRHHVYRPGEGYLLVGDEVVATKAGKHTHGLDRFFASLYLSLIHI